MSEGRMEQVLRDKIRQRIDKKCLNEGIRYTDEVRIGMTDDYIKKLAKMIFDQNEGEMFEGF